MNVRERLLERLEKAWREFGESYAGMPDSELMKPGVTGRWSVRDIIAHVTTWEEEALKNLPVLLKGGQTTRYSVAYGGINAFNALATGRKSGLSLREVLFQRDEIHRRLVDFIRTVPEEYLGSQSRFRHRLRMDTYGHYPKHAAAIRKLRMTNDE